MNGKSIEEASDIAGKPASKIWESSRELQDFLDDWGEFAYDQRRTIDEMRDFLGQRTNGLSPNHPLVKALGGPKATRDVFDSWWDRRPTAPEAASGWFQDFWNKIIYRGQEIKLNATLEAVQFGAGVAFDMWANFKYSYYDWKSQGFSDKEAAELAWIYTLERTPTDTVADVISLSDAGPKWLNILIQLGVRASLLIPDLGADGKVRPDVYDREAPSEAAGWQAESDKYASEYSNRGGPVKDPMRAKFNKRRHTKPTGYNLGGQVMREKFYRLSGKPLPKLIR